MRGSVDIEDRSGYIMIPFVFAQMGAGVSQDNDPLIFRQSRNR